MNISKISSPSFNGAYIVSGRGKDSKAAKEAIKANQSGIELKIDDLGYGYVGKNALAYFLVTTGSSDISTYNEFAKNWDEYKRIAELESPDYMTPQDFKSYEEYDEHIRRHQATREIEMVSRYCNFSSELSALSATGVLEAIKNNKFDIEEGKINKTE